MNREKLKEKIDEWINQDENRDFWVGENTTDLMTSAALAVIEAVRDAEKSNEANGHMVQAV